jgi:hypothetical protein
LTEFQSFDVPIFFLLGRYDWQVSAVNAEAYFENIAVPPKRLIWFEQSTYHPPFEEPEKFNKVLIQEVLPLAKTISADAERGRRERQSRIISERFRGATLEAHLYIVWRLAHRSQVCLFPSGDLFREFAKSVRWDSSVLRS